MGRTSADGENQTGIMIVPQAMAGMVRNSPVRASQSEASPRK